MLPERAVCSSVKDTENSKQTANKLQGHAGFDNFGNCVISLEQGGAWSGRGCHRPPPSALTHL